MAGKIKIGICFASLICALVLLLTSCDFRLKSEREVEKYLEKQYGQEFTVLSSESVTDDYYHDDVWRNIMVRATLAFAFLIGIVLLQIFLSRTERKWPGLILPVISFLFGFLYPFNMSAGTLIWQVFFVWLLGNIPTIIFLAIYFACRPKRKQTAGE